MSGGSSAQGPHRPLLGRQPLAMRWRGALLGLCMAWPGLGQAATPVAPAASAASAASADAGADPGLKDIAVESHGSLATRGRSLRYHAWAGQLAVHDSDDKPGAAMSYVAYFLDQPASVAPRPLAFVYNGGPGSASVWLHLGALGPLRIVTANGRPMPAAPYRLVPNEDSLLDACDLVFVDAPGTGFGRIAPAEKDPDKLKERRKAYWGVDQDAQAFERFVKQFLSRYQRWNSPKYLIGESYGTLRSAVLVSLLQQDSIDVNGVVLLSQTLSYNLGVDAPQLAPGEDLAYALALPTYAATAWYHHRLPDFSDASQAGLEALVSEVRRFAMGDYLQALSAGAALEPARRAAVIHRMSRYTGLPEAYLARANLRVNGGMFAHELLADQGLVVGRFDTRYSGPALDPMGKEADYDPQSSAISSAYVSAYNDYARRVLRLPPAWEYKPEADASVEDLWDYRHRPPGADKPLAITPNALPDLASALVQNPHLRVETEAGYFDLATPFGQAEYELDHLPVPAALRAHVQVRHYRAGHMMYDDPASLAELHQHLVRFIRDTDNLAP